MRIVYLSRVHTYSIEHTARTCMPISLAKSAVAVHLVFTRKPS